MPKLVVLVLLSLLSLSSCSPMSMWKRGSVRLCGSMLVETLSLVCKGDIYSPGDNSIGKRDIEQERADNYPAWLLGLSVTKPEIFDRHQALGRRQVFEGGIVDECCRKACSLSVLASYCGK